MRLEDGQERAGDDEGRTRADQPDRQQYRAKHDKHVEMTRSHGGNERIGQRDGRQRDRKGQVATQAHGICPGDQDR